MSRLVCVGDVVVDVALDVPGLPAPGGDVLARAGRVAAGGAFNVMSAAARLGLPCLYAGAHGTGPLGALARSALAAEGIAVVHPPEPGLDTGFSVTLVDPAGERTFLTAVGAEAALGSAHLARTPVAPGEIVYVSGYGLGYPVTGPALAAWLPELPDAVTVLCDPGPLGAGAAAAVLAAVGARTDWWSANATEAAALTGEAEPAAAAARLAARARVGALVRTGADGCVLALRGAPPRAVAPHAVRALDTTGAGDAHVGSFLAGLAGGLAPEQAARRANVAAALAVTRRGPATAPTAQELGRALMEIETTTGEDVDDHGQR
jgi:sugar/nucleoside kinase (ribokinase family)